MNNAIKLPKDLAIISVRGGEAEGVWPSTLNFFVVDYDWANAGEFMAMGDRLALKYNEGEEELVLYYIGGGVIAIAESKIERIPFTDLGVNEPLWWYCAQEWLRQNEAELLEEHFGIKD